MEKKKQNNEEGKKAADLISLPILMKFVEGPVLADIDGEEKLFNTAEECRELLGDEYAVESIQVQKIVVRKRADDRWTKLDQEKFGDEVSFF